MDVGWCLRADFPRIRTPPKGWWSQAATEGPRVFCCCFGASSPVRTEGARRWEVPRDAGAISCSVRGGPADRSARLPASARQTQSAGGRHLGETLRVAVRVEDDPQTASAASDVLRSPAGSSRLVERVREEMPELALISVILVAQDPKQGATSTSASRVRNGPWTLRERCVCGENGEKGATRATGNGCQRGANLRRVERWRESRTSPKLPQGSHERSGRNPANPMSGDGMQQARTPFAEKTVEVGHVPQGRNENPGRHARDRTRCQ